MATIFHLDRGVASVYPPSGRLPSHTPASRGAPSSATSSVGGERSTLDYVKGKPTVAFRGPASSLSTNVAPVSSSPPSAASSSGDGERTLDWDYIKVKAIIAFRGLAAFLSTNVASVSPSGSATSSALHRRLLIASAFVVVSILCWDHDLATLVSSSSSSSATSATRLSSSQQHQQQPLPIATSAYAVSITNCPPKLSARLYDAAAVLRRSIELNSWPLHATSRYASKFYAFMSKPADGSDLSKTNRCHQLLTKAGWEVLPQDPPLYTSLIEEPQGSILKMGIHADGCCGESELIKLSTYKLLDHEAAVHLDLDTLVTHPLDELFDVMHFDAGTEEGRRARETLAEVVAPTYVNRRSTGDPTKSGEATAMEVLANVTNADAFFTKDYNMISPGQQSKRVGVQGGFLTVRPSFETYSRLIKLVYSGEFYSGFDARTSGWFKSGYGRHIFGSLTIQGLMAYYFDVLEIESSIELNRCRYNNIADNARTSTFSINPKFPRGTLLPFVRNASNPRYNFHSQNCRDGRESCDDTDCQRFPVGKARVLHYTYCKNPWKCNGCEYLETYKEPTCYEMLREWFRVRSTLPGEGNRTLDRVRGNCLKEFFLGYCLEAGKYDPIKH